MPSPRRHRRPRPLRWHLVRLVLGVLLPVLVFASAAFFALARSERAGAERRVLASARGLAGAFDSELAGSMRALEALAASERLEHGDVEHFRGECVRVVGTQHGWLTVILATPDGTTRLNTAIPPGSPLPPVVETESFARAVATRAPTVGLLAWGRGAYANQLAVPVRVPVVRGGTLRYVLTAVVSADALGEVVTRQVSGDLEWTRTLVDPRGTVAARTRDPARFVGKRATDTFILRTREGSEGVFANTSLEGEPVYVAFARSASGWTAAVVSPRRVFDAPARRSLVAVGALGLALLLVSGVGAWAASRHIERSIAEAAEAADALARGAPVQLEPSPVRELVRLREALERSAQRLAAHEAERTAHVGAVEAARAEAVAATQAKDAFLAMLGHELRNPLAPIVTSLEALRLKGQAQSPEHEVIGRQLAHVVRLVDDLLDLSRIVRGQMSLQHGTVELAQVVGRALEAVAPLLERRGHALGVAVPPAGLGVWGDADRLTQVVTNLLTNAARYTPHGGHLQVRAGADGDVAWLAVQDDGEGLTPELQRRIFEPFVQGPRALDRGQGGLGIGLALVRSLVTAHGGRVEVHSDGPGRGSTFTVRLPRHASSGTPRTPPVPAPARPAPAARALRVLVVDDNVDAAEALADLLELSGHEVVRAHDAAGALARLDGFHPDVAILDIGLPEVDGYALAQRLRERLGDACPVLAALTGYGQAEDRARSAAAGFARHFVKPVRPDVLRAFLEAQRPGVRRGAA